MFCARCGKEIASTAALCPFCGAATRTQVQYTSPSAYQVKSYQDDLSSFGGPPVYQAGYSAVPSPVQQGGYSSFPQQGPSYAPPAYAPGYPPVNVTVVHTTSNDGALVAEIILSLFGVFGVGWIIGGETTTGVILLLCSIFLYWPIMILGTVFTLGIGLVCLGPLAIGAIILNVLLCSQALKRRAARSVIVQSPPPTIPMQPPMQRPQ